MMNRILQWTKKNPVLCLSGIAAFASACLVPPSRNYLSYIDLRVLCLLFCLMAVVGSLRSMGVFQLLAEKLLGNGRSYRTVVLVLVLLPFFTSMLVTNDVALITFVPFSLLVLRSLNKESDMIRITVLETIAANLGSMATPIGNPQNLLIHSYYHLSAADFFGTMGRPTVISFFLLLILVFFTPNEQVTLSRSSETTFPRPLPFGICILLFLLSLLSVFHILHYIVPTLCTLILFLIFDRFALKQVDWLLLLTFVFFFIFAGNIGSVPFIHTWLAEWMTHHTQAISVLTSQVISNVPAAVLLSGFTENWKSLLLGVNIGGLGTLIASLASLISFRFYNEQDSAKPGRYLLVFTAYNLLFLVILILSTMIK